MYETVNQTVENTFSTNEIKTPTVEDKGLNFI